MKRAHEPPSIAGAPAHTVPPQPAGIPRERSVLRRLAGAGALNFALTNRIPRVALTRLMGWFSRIQSPWLATVSLAVWRLFTDIDLSDAEPRRYRSLHEVFTRRLRAGARPIVADPSLLASPCDAIVGACGRVHQGQLLQAKDSAYELAELLQCQHGGAPWHDGVYVTLRLTSAMYHRFHAPHDLTVEQVNYIAGDAFNVNPPALARLPRLYCRTERAVLRCRLAHGGHAIALVPVAAVLVASIRLHCIDVLLHLEHREPHRWRCNAAVRKGEEMGWFEHGSTILVFAPAGFALAEGIVPGRRLRMGEPLMRLPTG